MVVFGIPNPPFFQLVEEKPEEDGSCKHKKDESKPLQGISWHHDGAPPTKYQLPLHARSYWVLYHEIDKRQQRVVSQFENDCSISPSSGPLRSAAAMSGKVPCLHPPNIFKGGSASAQGRFHATVYSPPRREKCKLSYYPTAVALAVAPLVGTGRLRCEAAPFAYIPNRTTANGIGHRPCHQ